MSRRRIEFAAKDRQLRDDVRSLGELVGRMLAEQGGPAFYELVEAVRRAAIRRREGDPGAGAELAALLAGMAAPAAAELVRAFAAYFQVVNLAEKVHRVRRRRDYQRQDRPQPNGVRDALERLRREGAAKSAVRSALERVRIEPVFTAHPSEATRRTLLEKQQRIARRLIERMDPAMTPPEARVLWARLRSEVTAAWQTEEHPAQRPTLADELEQVLFYLTDVVYGVVPAFYEVLAEAWEEVWDEPLETVPPILRFASWVGGDMDGNPNVSAATYRATLGAHRDAVLALYRGEVAELARRLSQSSSRVAVSAEVERRIADYGALVPAALAAVPPRHREMPYRVLLTLVGERLGATLAGGPAAYAGPHELDADLRLVADSLAANRGAHAGLFRVRRLLRRVATFGFHLAALDLRQDALVHRQVLGRLLADPSWLERPAGERAGVLAGVLAAAAAAPQVADAEIERSLAPFRAAADCRRRLGAAALGPFVVSMTEDVDDVLGVLVLARWAGLEEDGRVPLDVAPLFETVPDLEAAPDVMRRLLDTPVYAAHLAARGHRQTVMVGYSDSSKDGGVSASRWALQRAQSALADVLAARDVALTVFHGRGGTVSRGGGKTHRAVLAAPRGAVTGGLRVTEQGETIDVHYGLRGVALRHLERTAGAVLLRLARRDEPAEPGWLELFDEIARDSRRAYRRLVYSEDGGDPGFADYFRAATPIDVIERLRIGSRPASRRTGRGIEDLRAIPWVFAWTQSRHLLPGWYGLGSALEAAAARHGGERLAAMAAGWPFFGTLLEDAEMVLAKADLEISRRYAELAGPAGERFFPAIEAEYQRTVGEVLRLRGAEAPLDRDPALQRSILLRNPYVDPMSLLQVDLLRRWRAGERRDEELFTALVATVHGIARGLQNTG